MANDAQNVAASLPFEFIVTGTPRSIHSRNSRRVWTNTVKDAAAAAWVDDRPLGTEVNVTIVYFYRDGSIDVDNLIKPIMDAMNNVIYDDDALVSQVLARKTELRSGLEIGAASTSWWLHWMPHAILFWYV